ncbi:MAG: Maf family nucleotide pyrophosphatase [Pseudomonadales bacterium]|nr:Maf family nucleotide pyrophosphatase [Pseudomonadales bacterium]
MTSTNQPLILGSSSPFRKQLLETLGISFSTCSPDIDESPLSGETPEDLVKRLAVEKAKAVASIHPDALIISSDQVSVLDGQINGKPGSANNAIQQLVNSSGKTVTFFTSICLYDAMSGEYQLDLVPFKVHFRQLSSEKIRRYVEKERPFNCAGSFKSEGLGISLFERLEGDDPNSLIGLPLIKLVSFLEQKGIQIP